MNEPTKADLPLVVMPTRGSHRRVYDVRFRGISPYPWHEACGYIWRVNWRFWKVVPREELDAVPQRWTLAGGAGGMDAP